MCYERRRAEACVDESAHHAQCCLRCITKLFEWGSFVIGVGMPLRPNLKKNHDLA